MSIEVEDPTGTRQGIGEVMRVLETVSVGPKRREVVLLGLYEAGFPPPELTIRVRPGVPSRYTIDLHRDQAGDNTLLCRVSNQSSERATVEIGVMEESDVDTAIIG